LQKQSLPTTHVLLQDLARAIDKNENAPALQRGALNHEVKNGLRMIHHSTEDGPNAPNGGRTKRLGRTYGSEGLQKNFLPTRDRGERAYFENLRKFQLHQFGHLQKKRKRKRPSLHLMENNVEMAVN
jgi:hypothetical protein